MRVYGSWGTACLPVPERLGHSSGTEAFKLCCVSSLYVSLEVKEAENLERTVSVVL